MRHCHSMSGVEYLRLGHGKRVGIGKATYSEMREESGGVIAYNSGGWHRYRGYNRG